MKVIDVYIVKVDKSKTYTLVNPLALKADEFSVYVNDYELTNGNEYKNQNNVLTFTNPLEIGDKIQIEYSISDTVKIVTKNAYDKNSLYKIFSSNAKLKFNHTYNFSLNIEKETFSSKFYSKHDPFYTTIKKIRMDTGDLLDHATDYQIAQLIYLHSKDVQDTLGDSSSEIPVYATNVVRYQTDIDLCWQIYLSISGKYGVFKKKIGTIEVDQEVKLPYIETMIKRFKELLKPNEELLNGDNTTTASFVRAGNTTYTVTNRGVF